MMIASKFPRRPMILAEKLHENANPQTSTCQAGKLFSSDDGEFSDDVDGAPDLDFQSFAVYFSNHIQSKLKNGFNVQLNLLDNSLVVRGVELEGDRPIPEFYLHLIYDRVIEHKLWNNKAKLHEYFDVVIERLKKVFTSIQAKYIQLIFI